MKKILIFSLAYHPHVGGAEVAIKEITDRLPDIEWHMVTLRFSSADAEEEKIGNIFVHRVGSGSAYLQKALFLRRAAREARRLHRLHQFDAAWAMMSYMLVPLVRARLNIPYVLTLQEGDTEQHMFGRLRVWPYLYLINQGFKKASVVQAISNYLGSWAPKHGFIGPVEVIPNGVDVKKFSGEAVPHSGKALVTASRLVQKNAVDVIIRALPLLPDVRLVVAGSGADESLLRRLAQTLGVETRIEWRGFVDHDALPVLLHSCDIFVRPSRSEGMGNSFIEAMAAGLPVIATQEGGLSDFITPDVAWPVPKDSPEAVAAAVEAILGNPERTREVIERARRMALEKYDWDLIVEVMRDQVFSRVL